MLTEEYPDLELRGGGGVDLLGLLAFLFSVISFFNQNKEGGPRCFSFQQTVLLFVSLV